MEDDPAYGSRRCQMFISWEIVATTGDLLYVLCLTQTLTPRGSTYVLVTGISPRASIALDSYWVLMHIRWMTKWMEITSCKFISTLVFTGIPHICLNEFLPLPIFYRFSYRVSKQYRCLLIYMYIFIYTHAHTLQSFTNKTSYSQTIPS